MRKKMLSILLITSMMIGLFSSISLETIASEVQIYNDAITTILIDGNNIKADNMNGLTFKGFGVLSGNSTSALLMDYKSEQPEVYAELLQILFGGENPIMNQVKIEMGNDRNNSTGPDPATMRTEDEMANVKRHPGFQLAADAKKLNPDLKISILRWNAPAWANTNEKIYKWYKNTILAAYREYGYMVNYVNPGINEHAADLNWTKEYAQRIKTDTTGFNSIEEQNLYNKIEVMISDEVGIGSFGNQMISDATLRNAVSVAGYHYNTDDDSAGNFKRLAEEYDIEVWNSEAQATFSNSAFRPNNNTTDPTVKGTGLGGVGSALEMGNTIIKGFTNSRRTHFIYQPAIASFYEGGQYSSKEVVSARDPWSGWIHYDAAIHILRHFSSFAKTGWENKDNTNGIWRAIPQSSYTGATGTNPVNGRNGTPSYMTLAAPDGSDFSTVIINDSEYERTYRIQATNMSYTEVPSLEMWETRAADIGKAFNSNYMQYCGDINVDAEGIYTVRVKPYSIATVTTLQNQNKEEFNKPLPVEGERTVLDTDETYLYLDDFDYSDKVVPVINSEGKIEGSESYIESRGGSQGIIPRYTQDLNGAFEAYKIEDGNYVLRQQLDKDVMGIGGAWNGGDAVTAIGDYRWMNYKASVDITFENGTYGAKYAAIGARYQGGSQTITGTPYVLKYWYDGGWQLLVNGSVVADGNVVNGKGIQIPNFDATYSTWHNLAIQVAGNSITAYIDDVELATYIHETPKLSGRIVLGSDYTFVRFDNLKVEKIDGYEPYYIEQLDNLEMYDLADMPNQKLVYNELWKHENGKGMYVYHRSLSTNQGEGAILQYTFEGTGIDLLGANDGSANLEVTVDGEILIPMDTTMKSSELYQTYTLRGLKYGTHTVQLKVLKGNLAVDSVAVIGGQTKQVPDITELWDNINEAENIERLPQFNEVQWNSLVRILESAKEAATDPYSYRLDQEGAKQLIQRLNMAEELLYIGDVQEIESSIYLATYVGALPELPKTVSATMKDGTKTTVPVKWNLDDASFDESYSTVRVKGKVGSFEVNCYVEVVPEGLRYFTDLGATVDKIKYDSPAYMSIANFLSEKGRPLVNSKPDQVYTTTNGWGHSGSAINYKGLVAGEYSKLVTTGIYGENKAGKHISYTFNNLSAGEYRVTIGSHSWWPSYERKEKIYLEYDAKSEPVDTITLNSSNPNTVRTYSFTMNTEGSFNIKLVAETNQAPMLSFVGLEAVQDADKTALQVIYDQYKDTINQNYSPEKWQSFQIALDEALRILQKIDATQVEVDTAFNEVKQSAEDLTPDAIKEIKTSHYLATYVGQIPELPQTVEAIRQDGQKTSIPISWDLENLTFDIPYEKVIVTGYVGDLQAKCYVEVIPEGLMYFADINATTDKLGYDSPAYNSIAAFLDEKNVPLVNSKPDQVYSVISGWGHSGSKVNYKGVVKGDHDKLVTTGIYGDNNIGAFISYTFDNLPAGKYNITLGSYNWWSGYTREEKIYLQYEDQMEYVDTITLNNELIKQVKDYTFTMNKQGSFTLKIEAGTAQGAVLSFVGLAAIEELQVIDKTELQQVYDNSKNIVDENYTDISWEIFEDALSKAKSVLEKQDVTQNEIDATVDSLKQAIEGLVKKQDKVKTAAEMAVEIKEIKTPNKGDTKLILPNVDEGFSIEIHSSSNPDVIKLDGTIIPPQTTTSAALVLKVTKDSDGDNALTSEIDVTVPGEDQTVVDKGALQQVYDVYKNKENEDYTEVSWEIFEDALSKAKSVLEKQDVTQNEIDATVDSLKQAIEGLVKKQDKVKTAAEMAAEIKEIKIPNKGDTKLILPNVDEGFSIEIHSSSNPDVIKLDGTIIPPQTTTSAALVLKVTKDSDGDNALTQEIVVIVVAKATEPDDNNSDNSNTEDDSIYDEDETDTKPYKQESVVDENGAILVKPSQKVDDTGTAFVVITDQDIKKALQNNVVGQNGIKKIVVEIQKVNQANGYTVALPKVDLTTSIGTQRVEIRTEIATLTVLNNMLSNRNLGEASKLEIVISRAKQFPINNIAIDSVKDKSIVTIGVKADNNTVKYDNPNSPIIVSLDYVPSSMELKKLEHIVVWYIDDEGNVQPVPNGRYDESTNKVTFTTTHDGNYAVAFVEKTFGDITNYSWAKEAIEVMASKGIINGTSETTYNPGENITRADFICLLVNALGLTADFDINFKDVKVNQYYYESIGIARELGIINGKGDGEFYPQEEVSRQDMMVMVAKAMNIVDKITITGTNVDITGYSDSDEISLYAVESIVTLINSGIIQGAANKEINPKEMATRAEAAVIMYKLYNYGI